MSGDYYNVANVLHNITDRQDICDSFVSSSYVLSQCYTDE